MGRTEGAVKFQIVLISLLKFPQSYIPLYVNFPLIYTRMFHCSTSTPLTLSLAS